MRSKLGVDFYGNFTIADVGDGVQQIEKFCAIIDSAVEGDYMIVPNKRLVGARNFTGNVGSVGHGDRPLCNLAAPIGTLMPKIASQRINLKTTGHALIQTIHFPELASRRFRNLADWDR